MKKRVFLAIILLILISLTGGVVYLNKVFIPQNLRPLLEEKISAQIKRRIELKSLRYELFKGFTLKNIRIFDRPPEDKKVTLAVKKVQFNILFLPLLKSKKIVIPALYIDSPAAKIKYRGDKTFGLSSFKQAGGGKFRLIITRIVVKNGSLLIEDLTKKPSFKKEISNLNADLGLSLPRSLRFLLRASAKNTDKSVAALSLKGTYNLGDSSFDAEANLENLLLSGYRPYLGKLPFSLSSARLKELNVSSKKEKSWIRFRYDAAAEEIALAKDKLTFAGGLKTEGNLALDPGTLKTEYLGEAEITGGTVSGIPLMGNAERVAAKVSFEKGTLTINSLTAESQGCPLKINGTVGSLTEPLVDLKLSAKLKLNNLNGLIEKLIEKKTKPFSFSLEGDALVNAELRGNLKNINNLMFSGKAKLAGGSLLTQKLPSPVEGIEGTFFFDKENLRWQNFSLKYNGRQFILNGGLANFSSPLIETALSGESFNAKTKFALKGDGVKIAYLALEGFNSKANLSGRLNIKNPEKPPLNLKGTLSLDTGKIKEIGLKFGKKMDFPVLEGTFEGKFALRGSFSDIANAEISLRGSSGQGAVNQFQFTALSLNYTQKGRSADAELSSNLYQGTLKFLANLKILADDTAYTATINLENLDLAELKKDTSFKNKDLSGKINLAASLTGQAKDLSALKGNAKLTINEGRLWELNLFKGLGKLILPASFEKIVFNEVAGGFLIEEEKVKTDNLKLSSEELELTARGDFDFAGNLDFNLSSKFNTQRKEEANGFKNILSSIITQTQDYLTVRVTGTLQNPKYKILPQPEKIFDKFFDTLKKPLR